MTVDMSEGRVRPPVCALAHRSPPQRTSSRVSAKRTSAPIIDEEESDDFAVAPKPKPKAQPKKAAAERDVESISDGAGSVVRCRGGEWGQIIGCLLISTDDFQPVRTASGRVVKSPKTLASERTMMRPPPPSPLSVLGKDKGDKPKSGGARTGKAQNRVRAHWAALMGLTVAERQEGGERRGGGGGR